MIFWVDRETSGVVEEHTAAVFNHLSGLSGSPDPRPVLRWNRERLLRGLLGEIDDIRLVVDYPPQANGRRGRGSPRDLCRKRSHSSAHVRLSLMTDAEGRI
jgi:hypothetical protein